MTLSELCCEIRNWDFNSRAVKLVNLYEIKDGTIDLTGTGIKPNQYFRIIGSLFNDGIYQHDVDDTNLTDEEFYGSVWLMAIPSEILNLVNEINDWQEKNSDSINSPFNSESFGGYSYSKSNDSVDWRKVFASKLNRWRKI